MRYSRIPLTELVPPTTFRRSASAFTACSALLLFHGTPSNSRNVEVPEYWMDRHEVTNKQFKQFVDAGAYEKPDYWKQPFVENGRTLSRQEAMSKLLDKTGRPGPSTWELGNYPEGRGDNPVTGVSWYEAAAYAGNAAENTLVRKVPQVAQYWIVVFNIPMS